MLKKALPAILPTLAALFLALAAKAEPPALTAYLPAGAIKGSLMRLAFDKSANDISLRFNEAIAQSPEWFQNYMSENAGVKPLPYHKNFGITEEEYSAMLKSFESRKLEKIRDVALFITRGKDGSILIDCPELGKQLAGIAIDPKTAKLSTPWLQIAAPEPKRGGSVDDGNPFGDWDGCKWKSSERKTESGDYKSVSLCIGRSSTLKTGFIAYRVKDMEANRIVRNFESIVEFPLANPEKGL